MPDDTQLLSDAGARNPRAMPGGGYLCEMDLAALGPVPVVVRISRDPVGADQVAIAVGLSVSVAPAAIVIIAAAGRDPMLEETLRRFEGSACPIRVITPSELGRPERRR